MKNLLFFLTFALCIFNSCMEEEPYLQFNPDLIGEWSSQDKEQLFLELKFQENGVCYFLIKDTHEEIQCNWFTSDDSIMVNDNNMNDVFYQWGDVLETSVNQIKLKIYNQVIEGEFEIVTYKRL